MSYYSSIAGRVRMTRKAFEEFAKESVSGISVKKYLDTLDYVDTSQELILDREGYEHDDDYLVNLLAKYKDLPGIDMVEYAGEESGDMGRFYIDIGRWCYVAAEPPPPPKLEEFWYYVEKHK